MAWALKWGSHVKAFESQARKTGKVPAPLKSRPRLKREDLAYYEAFTTLSKARQHGAGGSQPIPVSEVLAYCTLVGIASPGVRAKYLALVQEMDQLCLEHWAEVHEKSKT